MNIYILLYISVHDISGLNWLAVGTTGAIRPRQIQRYLILYDDQALKLTARGLNL